MSEKGHHDRGEDDRDDRHKDKRGREEFEFSTTTRGSQVAEYLNRIADGLRAGTLTLGSSGHSVHLRPGETIRLEVEAESKPDKGSASLQLELSWKMGTAARQPHDEVLVIETDGREIEARTPQLSKTKDA